MSVLKPICRLRRKGIRCVVRALAVVLAIVNSAQGRVEVHVAHVGFPRVQGGDVIRSGAWVPIIVDVALAEQASFDGSVRIAQLDHAGDECFDTVDVHIRAETGGSQRVYLYVPANPLRGQGRFFVEVRNAEGEAVKIVTQGELSYRAESAEPPTVIAADDLLVLSISSSTVGRVSELLSSEKRSLFT